ncbi:hypothetical protein D3C80_1365110 [compost metagenome]
MARRGGDRILPDDPDPGPDSAGRLPADAIAGDHAGLDAAAGGRGPDAGHGRPRGGRHRDPGHAAGLGRRAPAGHGADRQPGLCDARRRHGHRPAGPRRRAVAAVAGRDFGHRRGRGPADLRLCRPADGGGPGADRSRLRQGHPRHDRRRPQPGPQRDGGRPGGPVAHRARGAADRRPDRLHRRAEGVAGHPDPAPVQLRHPGRAGLELRQ